MQDDTGETPVLSWVAMRRMAELRPSMWTGGDALGAPIAGTLEAVWRVKSLRKPSSARLRVSPLQYHLRIEAGPLADPIQKAIEWETCDHLDRTIVLASRQLSLAYYHRSTVSFVDFTAALILADRGVLAIRTDAGLWCQSYEHGWPKMPPFLLKNAAPSVGLMVAASLSPRWFPDLPYSLEAVEKRIPKIARPHVTVEWHPEDDLVPACEVDPRCVLHAENIERWL
jgi:hypothetical protein